MPSMIVRRPPDAPRRDLTDEEVSRIERETARMRTDPDLGPSHIAGDHSAGSLRRWVLGGGLRRAAAEERAAEAERRRRVASTLWSRVHPGGWPPWVVHLRNYKDDRPPGEPPTTTENAAGRRAGHLTTTDEGSALSSDRGERP